MTSNKLGVETDGLVPISKAAEKAKVPAITVVHMILGGFLERVFRLAGQDAVGALRVDPVEVKRHRDACTAGLSPLAAFSTLKIPRDVGWALVDRYPDQMSLAVNWITCPNEGHCIPSFDREVVAEFRAQFTHPARLAETHDLQIGEVIGRLKRRGIRPLIERAEIGVDFYRTSDLKADLFI